MRVKKGLSNKQARLEWDSRVRRINKH